MSIQNSSFLLHQGNNTYLSELSDYSGTLSYTICIKRTSMAIVTNDVSRLSLTSAHSAPFGLLIVSTKLFKITPLINHSSFGIFHVSILTSSILFQH